MPINAIKETVSEKRLYDYQIKDLNRIFDVMAEESFNFNLLFRHFNKF